jgi:hypothetical protein
MRLSRLTGTRHKPRTSKSRWRKTLDRRYRPHEILEASRRQIIMKVRWHPKDEAEARSIEEHVFWGLAVMGTAMVLPPSLEQFERLKKKLEVQFAGTA